MAMDNPMPYVAAGLALGAAAVYASVEAFSFYRLNCTLNEYMAVRDFHTPSKNRLDELMRRYVQRLRNMRLTPIASESRDNYARNLDRQIQYRLFEEVIWTKTDGSQESFRI